jgi:hypothetical protein
MQYKQFKDKNGEISMDVILCIESSGLLWYVPNNNENSMWQAYQAWLAADPNNQPEAAD